MFADNADYKYPFDQGVVEFEKAYSFFIQNISLPAGRERVTSIIANNLAEKGYDITILSICG